MQNKLPVLITYKKTHDNGQELRYVLRSLSNIKNWSGEVFVVGAKEKWFKNITHIPCPRQSHDRYLDVGYKIETALNCKELPDDFILLMDDVYTTEPTEVNYLHGGEIPNCTDNPHKRSLTRTADWLAHRGYSNLNYDLHVPFIMNRKRQLEVNRIIIQSIGLYTMQARSLYGNIFKVGGEFYEDKKTKTHDLKEGLYLSTQFYTCGLNELFPKPSKFEII